MQRKIIIGLVLTLVVLVFIPVYWATEPARQQAAQARVTAQAVERGAKVFAATCAACHGKTGDALPGKNLRQTKLDEEALTRAISRGRGVMPAFSKEEGGPLKPHEIDDVVVFLRNWDQSLVEALSHPAQPPATASPKPPAPAPSPVPPSPTPSPTPPPAPKPPTPPTSTTPPAPPSPAIDAKALYAGKCAMCHGANREGGLGPALTAKALAAGSDTDVRNAILDGRPGTAMMPFKASLTPEEVTALVQFLKSTP